MRRIMLDMRQCALDNAFGITFQQVQKYEKGTNRISASRIQQVSTFLQVPIPFFFGGLPDPTKKSAKSVGAPPPSDVFQLLATADGLSLGNAFMRVKRSDLRRSIVDLVGRLAGNAPR